MSPLFFSPLNVNQNSLHVHKSITMTTPVYNDKIDTTGVILYLQFGCMTEVKQRIMKAVQLGGETSILLL